MFDFTGIKFDKIVLFNFENGLSMNSIYQKRSRRSRYSREEDDPALALAGAFMVYVVSLFYNYRFNRPEFWRLVIWGSVVLVVLVALIIGIARFRNWSRERRLQKLLKKIQDAGLKQEIKNFILHYGKEKGTRCGNWVFQDYFISWSKINSLQAHAARKGATLDNSETSILLQHYIREKELWELGETISATT